MKKFLTKKSIIFFSGLLLGALVILAIRVVIFKPEKLTHYHANFNVYINGQQEKFQGFQYYEEIGQMACTVKEVDSPVERAHMHDNIYDVVHVEDKLTTWGNFFQYLRFGLGDDYIRNDKQVFVADDTNKLTFILNGEKVDSIQNKVIGDRDRLLVNYGNQSNEEVKKLYDKVPSNAEHYDTAPDPASCSGSKRKAESRWKHLF